MADNISAIDLEGLRQTAQSQSTAVQDGRNQLNNFREHVDNLFGGWSGESAKTFVGAMYDFHDSGHNLLTHLDHMQRLMVHTQGGFTATHDSVLESARQAVSAIDPNGLPGSVVASPLQPTVPNGLPGL